MGLLVAGRGASAGVESGRGTPPLLPPGLAPRPLPPEPCLSSLVPTPEPTPRHRQVAFTWRPAGWSSRGPLAWHVGGPELPGAAECSRWGDARVQPAGEPRKGPGLLSRDFQRVSHTLSGHSHSCLDLGIPYSPSRRGPRLCQLQPLNTGKGSSWPVQSHSHGDCHKREVR